MRRLRYFVFATPATYEHWHSLGYRRFCKLGGNHGRYAWIMELCR